MFVNTRLRIKGRAGMANTEYPTMRDHGSRRILKDKVPARRRSPYFHVVTHATGVPSPVHDYHPTRIEHQFFNLTLLARLGTHRLTLSRLEPGRDELLFAESPILSAEICGGEDSLGYLWGLTEVGL